MSGPNLLPAGILIFSAISTAGAVAMLVGYRRGGNVWRERFEIGYTKADGSSGTMASQRERGAGATERQGS